MEIDLPGAPELLLVAFEDRTEYRKERLRPPRVPVGTSPVGDVREGQPVALEVLQEGRHQARERIDPFLLFENGEHFLARDWRQGHAVGRELLGQVAEQPAVGVFMAEGLDQDGAVCGMDLALPVHLAQILLPVDVRRGPARCIDSEVLHVDARDRGDESRACTGVSRMSPSRAHRKLRTHR